MPWFSLNIHACTFKIKHELFFSNFISFSIAAALYRFLFLFLLLFQFYMFLNLHEIYGRIEHQNCFAVCTCSVVSIRKDYSKIYDVNSKYNFTVFCIEWNSKRKCNAIGKSDEYFPSGLCAAFCLTK